MPAEALIDLGVHVIDLVRYLSDTPAVSAYGVVTTISVPTEQDPKDMSSKIVRNMYSVWKTWLPDW